MNKGRVPYSKFNKMLVIHVEIKMVASVIELGRLKKEEEDRRESRKVGFQPLQG